MYFLFLAALGRSLFLNIGKLNPFTVSFHKLFDTIAGFTPTKPVIFIDEDIKFILNLPGSITVISMHCLHVKPIHIPGGKYHSL